MRSRLFLVAAAILACSLVAHADNSQVFDLSGVLDTGSSDTFNGTVTIDTTTGAVTDSSFTVNYAGTPYAFSGTPEYSGVNGGADTYEGFGNYPAQYFVFNVPVATLVGYTGGPLCSDTNYCPDGSGDDSTFYDASGNVSVPALSGALTLASSATPEPSSLALLGTGLLGAVGVIRKRLA